MPDNGSTAPVVSGLVDSTKKLSNPTSSSVKTSSSQIESAERNMPAIYDVDGAPSEAKFQTAASLGFNMIGFPTVDENQLSSCRDWGKEYGISVMTTLDFAMPDASADILQSNPECFAGSPEGARFFYLSETDPVVDWWNSRIESYQAAGVGAFKCLNIGVVPTSVLMRLLGAAKERYAASLFFAWTPGLSPATLGYFEKIGFDFSFSSSCWWDFRAGWLNGDAQRISKIGPAIALATPPKTVWPTSTIERQRAIMFAACYAPGWLMPAGFEIGEGYDLSEYIASCNELRMSSDDLRDRASATLLSSIDADVAVLRRGSSFGILLNPSLKKSNVFGVSNFAVRLEGVLDLKDHAALGDGRVELAPGEIVLGRIHRLPPIATTSGAIPDCDLPRLAIESITPKIDDGQFPVRRIVGETIVVEADIIGDGHDKLSADLLWREVDTTSWHRIPMRLLGNDRWCAEFRLERLGRHVFAVEAWKDYFLTFVDEVEKKAKAGVLTPVEIEEGVILVQEAVDSAKNPAEMPLQALLAELKTGNNEARRELLVSNDVVRLMRSNDVRKFLVRSGEVLVDAERTGARFASWYEIFPRSQTSDAGIHGTFHDVIERLPRIAAMGFDVLYFPPIHPIGRVNRKGRNNTLTPAPEDPGSPYAIGADEGGHDSIHPELGDFDDFQALRKAAASYGIELALDFAIQCAPDHPWLRDHKEWFDWRPDGSLRYAENPPKKYEDIVNVDFYSQGAKPALWIALRDIVQFWVDQGISLFRVDNPHTKPFPFWEWLISDIRGRQPRVVFLAEAFTRPKVMYRLAKVGFSQSYTYFTWRNTKSELIEYLTELNETVAKEFFRPHFFVNTPDINPIFLQNSGRAGFLIRAALAATLSGLWGVYNGFELCEAEAVAPGKEEYRDSEKYQIRVWDYDRPGNIIDEISKLNEIRRGNSALQSHLGLQFHNAFDEDVLYFSKTSNDGNMVLVAVSLDPFNSHTFEIEVPLWSFGLPDDAALIANDLMRDFEFVWQGKSQSVTLHPASPFCIWRIRPVETLT
jgi:starch synthase (maltosyl-transferring)